MIPMQLAALKDGDVFKLARDSNQEFNFSDTMRGEGGDKIKIENNWMDSSVTVFVIEEVKG